MPMDFTDVKSKLVQVMAWCHQALNKFLSHLKKKKKIRYFIETPQ